MSGDKTASVEAERLKRAEEYIEREEGAQRRLAGLFKIAVVVIATAMTLYHLYAGFYGQEAYVLRRVHLGFVLLLIFLLFPLTIAQRGRIQIWDWIAAAAGVAAIAYLLHGGDDLMDRASTLEPLDIAMGVLLIALVLEAARRTTGIVMPIVALGFLAYAMFGHYLPPPWIHRGYGMDRIVGHLYVNLEGIFGSALDVSATLIILFTIFGAVLKFSGAGQFFIDFSFAAMGGKRSSAGRAIVMSSFLLGGPSGSGVATTVTLGAVAWPLLRKAGYAAAPAGGLLAAGGLGAILSPPVLGAAAFLIAEFLKISYLDVIWMATIPTILYYFCLFVMVETDAAKFGVQTIELGKPNSILELVRRQGFHFTSLVSVIVLMLTGRSPELSVVWAILIAIAVSYLSRETALTPKRLVDSLAGGSIDVLGTAATCAAAGIIVGVVTLTGLGQKFGGILIDLAGGVPALVALYAAFVIWVIGLAVPVTASYIICAQIVAPALIKIGIPDFAAHMFIFYYALLSEVSPPTALSPFAASAITGGDPYATTMQAWKYTMPAFLVPFVFILDPLGVGLLLKEPASGGILGIIWVLFTTAIGIIACAAATQGWLLRATTAIERTLFGLAGVLLLFPAAIDAMFEAFTRGHIVYAKVIGLVIVAGLAAWQFAARRG